MYDSIFPCLNSNQLLLFEPSVIRLPEPRQEGERGEPNIITMVIWGTENPQ